MGASATSTLKSQIEKHVYDQVYNELTSSLEADQTQRTDLEEHNLINLKQDKPTKEQKKVHTHKHHHKKDKKDKKLKQSLAQEVAKPAAASLMNTKGAN